MKVEEEMFGKVFGQSVEEMLGETSEEGVVARARKVESFPNRKEVEERSLDHPALRSWHPHCVKGRAEAYGHKREGEGGNAPTVILEHTHTRSEPEKEEDHGGEGQQGEDGDGRVAPSKGVHESAVGVVRKFVEQLGHRKAIVKSDAEPAILALKGEFRRGASVEIVMDEPPVGDHHANGVAENAVKNAQGLLRVLKNALESRINTS
jgi:hypothetical protein